MATRILLIKKIKNMETKREQHNHIMSTEEKEAYTKIIKALPHLYSPILKTIQENINKKDNDLLDVGCGDGYLLGEIKKIFPKINLLGIDTDQYMINKGKNNFPNIDFQLGTADNYKEESDITICNLCIHHIDNPVGAIKNMYKRTKRVLIISDQIRPSNETELEKRLEKRKNLISEKDVPYYKENERESILEAYSEKEILDIFDSTNLEYKIQIFDEDYYKRFVAIIEKGEI